MSLAIFDLDNASLSGDSDYLWEEFLVENYSINLESYLWNNIFYDQYHNGIMDIFKFLSFQLKLLVDNKIVDLYKWREKYLQEKLIQ